MAKINIDFQVIQTYDPKTLIVIDTSEWLMIENKPAIIEIILPGEKNPVTHYFDKGKVNVFNSINLGLMCPNCGGDKNDYMDLPDGIYRITVKGSPDTFNFSRSYLKLDKTQLELDSYIASLNLSCNQFSDDVISRLNKINILLSAAESNTRLGNFCAAQELLFKVQKQVRKLKRCKACV